MRLFVVTVLALLALAAPARAGLVVDEGSSFGQGTLVNPQSVAVDDAGRVYVADAGAGHVAVFASGGGSTPNRFLQAIGDGQLQQPVGVAVDNRQRLYVADAGRNLVFEYDSYFEKFKPLGTLAQPGQAPGQLDGPRALTTDSGQKVYVMENGNLRLSVFRPARAKTIVFQSAFGLAQGDPPVRSPTGVARDSGGRLFVPSAIPNGFVRAVDHRGRFIANIGAGLLSSPEGVAIDRFNRLLVADTGNNRLVVWGPIQQGGRLLETFAGPLVAPRAVAFAPGSLLYALEADRVVALRWDDADRDGVTDAGDTCVGLANPDQDDTDGDGKGNACDADDDGDGEPDTTDTCPTERATIDGNGDGCQDPVTRIISPTQGRRFNSAPPRLTGSADGGSLGIAAVEVALGKRLGSGRPDSPGQKCSWYQPSTKRFVSGTCAKPIFYKATGTESWQVRVPSGLLKTGGYVLAARTQQPGGMTESRLTYGRNLRSFSVGR